MVPGLSGASGSEARQSAVRDAPATHGFHTGILLVHGYSGHRRESTFMGTHLASHGYVVASADHTGSTFPDIDTLVEGARREGRRFVRADIMPGLIIDRQGDVPFMIDTLVESFDISAGGIGITGASLGGWTSLMAPTLDARVRASAPMCPSGGSSPVYPRGRNHAAQALDFEWKSEVATMFMVADHDSWLPLYGEIELLRRVPGSKRMFVLERADHNHFVDDVAGGHEWLRAFTAGLAEVEAEGGTDWGCIARNMLPFDDLCSEDKALTCWRGLCTAHMDAHLKEHAEARALFEGDVPALLAARGTDIVEIRAAGLGR